MKEIKKIAATLKRELSYYQRVYHHPKTPTIAKIFLWLAIGYLLMPFDLIPDFIPIIGHLDDMVVIPLLILLAIKLIPKNILSECK